MSEQEQQTAETKQDETRPDWLPEKFWKDGKVDNEGLAKSYKELEQKFSRKQAADGNDDLTVTKAAATTTSVPETADEALAQAGIDLGDIIKSVAETGRPSDEHYAKLEKVGWKRWQVDETVRARGVLAVSVRDTALNAAGGEDGYRQMVQWAAQNADKSDIADFDKAIQGFDPDAAKRQVELMMWRMERATGAGGSRKLISGSPAPSAGGGFQSYKEKSEASAKVSRGEMTVEEYNRRFAMTDPKFHHPPRRQ